MKNNHPSYEAIRKAEKRSSVENTRYILQNNVPDYCRRSKGAAFVGCSGWEERSPPCQKPAEATGPGPSPLACFPLVRAYRSPPYMSPPQMQPGLWSSLLSPKNQQALFFVLKPQTRLRTGRHAPSPIGTPRAEAGRELLCRNQLTCAQPQGWNWANWLTPWLGLSS